MLFFLLVPRILASMIAVFMLLLHCACKLMKSVRFMSSFVLLLFFMISISAVTSLLTSLFTLFCSSSMVCFLRCLFVLISVSIIMAVNIMACVCAMVVSVCVITLSPLRFLCIGLRASIGHRMLCAYRMGMRVFSLLGRTLVLLL